MKNSQRISFKKMAAMGLSLAIVSGSAASAYAGESEGLLIESIKSNTMDAIRLKAGASRVGKMWLQSGLPQDQVKLLMRDRQVLQTFKFGAADSIAVRYMLGIPSATPAQLATWLEDRVQVVVDENFSASKSAVIFPSPAKFENSGVLPDLEKSTIKPSGKGVTIMANLGASLYYFAKSSQQSVGVKIPGIGTLEVNSPRTGIIQIGPGLFMGRRIVEEKNLDAPANSVPRLATFFHEARHSDGNGKSLAFLHAVCSVGHAMAGYHACDRNLNGPYTVGAWTGRGMTESCTDCTVEQREKLRLQYLDSFGRVLEKKLDGTATVFLDPKPEGKR